MIGEVEVLAPIPATAAIPIAMYSDPRTPKNDSQTENEQTPKNAPKGVVVKTEK